jgi:secondary thiamine-phosphate synthase enzyme
MVTMNVLRAKATPGSAFLHQTLHIRTRHCLEFCDITDQIQAFVRETGVATGMASIQTRHTTTAVIVNENEPLLLEDLRQLLDELAPRDRVYQHDDMARRKGPLPPDEPINGHSHCKAVFLATSQVINVAGGVLQLGRWQRIFLVELDSARDRTVSVMIMGTRP